MAPRGERATLGPGLEREGTLPRRRPGGVSGAGHERPRPRTAAARDVQEAGQYSLSLPQAGTRLHPQRPKCVQGGLLGFGAEARSFKRLSAQAAHGAASLLPAAAPPRPRPLPLPDQLESPAAACGRDVEGSRASQGFSRNRPRSY